MSVECPTCAGQGCENGCGNCTMSPSTAGPDAHKVCRECGGTGVKEEGYHVIDMDGPECLLCGAHPGESHLMRHCALAIAGLV